MIDQMMVLNEQTNEYFRLPLKFKLYYNIFGLLKFRLTFYFCLIVNLIIFINKISHIKTILYLFNINMDVYHSIYFIMLKFL